MLFGNHKLPCEHANQGHQPNTQTLTSPDNRQQAQAKTKSADKRRQENTDKPKNRKLLSVIVNVAASGSGPAALPISCP